MGDLEDALADAERAWNRVKLLENQRGAAADALFGRSRQPGLKVKLLTPGAKMPTYATDGSAGLDLYADCSITGPWSFAVGSTSKVYKISTGIAIELPPGHVGLMRGRSGLSSKGLIVIGGTIDADYRGPVGVMFWVQSGMHEIIHGDRIAQMLIMPVPRCSIVEEQELSETARGEGGFGHSGR
jgi:dUTP pyrophosphatase